MQRLITIVVILGVFVFASFFLIAFILRSRKLGIGYWPLLGSGVFFLTLGAYASKVMNNMFAFDYFFLIAMILFGVVALFKFWDIMRLIE
jgi:multidrug transporter EmrE-like cation transporter